jgi:hypothetical protein
MVPRAPIAIATRRHPEASHLPGHLLLPLFLLSSLPALQRFDRMLSTAEEARCLISGYGVRMVFHVISYRAAYRPDALCR